MSILTSTDTQHESLQSYYRLHAGIYDATRWSFLFGRRQALNLVAGTEPERVLEVGCGTGANLATLCQLFPGTDVTGIDLSAPMMDQAWSKLKSQRGRVRLVQGAYNQPLHEPGQGYDLVVCSYALTMFNPGWEQAIQCAYDDLKPGGRIVVVDFHDSGFGWFRRWMQVNHVRMEGHLRPVLQSLFRPEIDRTCRAYGGLWRYFMYVGQKSDEAIV